MRTVFSNATVIDGTGSKPFCADVVIEGDTIDFVGKYSGEGYRIDCTDRILCPGFMDIHAHSDLEVLRNPAMEHKIQQGITFDLSGNCGIGTFPRRITGRPMFADILGTYPTWDWRDFSSYCDRLEPGINMAFLQGHGSLRTAALRGNANRPATDAEVQRMCTLLEKSLEQGCLGMSTGLFYAPCMYAERKELIALLSVLKKHNALFTVHHRCEGNEIVQSIDEVISLVRETGVRLQVSHLKAIGRKNQRHVATVLEKLHELKDQGFDVAFDQYPYEYGSTSLFSLLPPDLLELDNSTIRQTLGRAVIDRTIRDSLIHEMQNPKGWDSITELCPWQDITIVLLGTNPQYNGLTMLQVAEKLEMDPYQALFHLLSKEIRYALMSDITQTDESLRTIFMDDLMTFGTDALYIGETAHPRSANAAIHLLEQTCIKGDIPWEFTINRMTGKVADRLGIGDRGKLLSGNKADLVLLDPRSLRDNSDSAHPFWMCTGLEAVVVNGVFALRDGKLTGSRSGKPIR